MVAAGNSNSQTLRIGPIPMVPPSGNVMRRKYRNYHVYAGLRNTWQSTIRAFLPPGRHSYELVERMMRVTITVEHKRFYDQDNLVSGCKPVLDSLTNLGLIRNDSAHWIELHVEQVKGPNCETLIEVMPCPVP